MILERKRGEWKSERREIETDQDAMHDTSSS